MACRAEARRYKSSAALQEEMMITVKRLAVAQLLQNGQNAKNRGRGESTLRPAWAGSG
jgi:hypothetical protein